MKFPFLPEGFLSGPVFCFAIAGVLTAAEPRVLEVNFAKPEGTIRALHGVNKGPLGSGGLLDVTEAITRLGVPTVRLHDCHWPVPDVVDFHTVFPRFEADASRPESYDFRLTDLYLEAVRRTGAKMIYRLGQSIEHTTVRRYVHPPADAAQWSSVGLGIIRHYNEGWAGGAHHDIRYWEIWNEPDNRPAMWSGSDADYFKLYATASRAIKARYPTLKIGGPGLGNSGEYAGGRLTPPPFLTKFLDFCRTEALPLDFFSWHCYTADPAELTGRAREIRALLDSAGFVATESHLNEWNYLPGNSWAMDAVPEEKDRYFAEMSGPAGAAFMVSALLALQDAPVDMANLFHGEAGSMGLFSENGSPRKSYYALQAFKALLDHPNRVQLSGSVPGKLSAMAGWNGPRNEAVVLISCQGGAYTEVQVKLNGMPWTGDSLSEVRLVDGDWNFAGPQPTVRLAEGTAVPLSFHSSTVALVTLRAAP